jgi:hypothetical protein
MSRRRVLLLVLVIAHACVVFGCEIEVPLVEHLVAPDAASDGARSPPDAGSVDVDGRGGLISDASTFDAGSPPVPDAAMFD